MEKNEELGLMFGRQLIDKCSEEGLTVTETIEVLGICTLALLESARKVFDVSFKQIREDYIEAIKKGYVYYKKD